MTYRYYVTAIGETAEDAIEFGTNAVSVPVFAAEDAAEHWWNNRDGWELGIDQETTAVLIHPDGTESRWHFCYEAEVRHTAVRIREENNDD